jgi:hypothetical protein
MIDVWLCNPADMYAGLGQKAVNNRLKVFERYDTDVMVPLDGEAWVKTRDKRLVLDNLKLLGIRKRAERSAKTRQAMMENLKAGRETQTTGQTATRV